MTPYLFIVKSRAVVGYVIIWMASYCKNLFKSNPVLFEDWYEKKNKQKKPPEMNAGFTDYLYFYFSISVCLGGKM